MDAREHAVRLAVLKYVSDQVKNVDVAARAAATAEILPGDRISAALPDGTVIGSVTRSKVTEGTGWVVKDPAKFLVWVKANVPHAITESVRPSDQEAILKRIETTGVVPDGVDEVPTRTGGVISVRSDKEAVAVIDWRPFVNETYQIEEK